MDSICPDAVDERNLQEMKGQAGLIWTLDTTVIQNNFLIENANDGDQDADADLDEEEVGEAENNRSNEEEGKSNIDYN